MIVKRAARWLAPNCSTVLAQLCGPKANATEMVAALFTKNVEGSKFDFDFETNYT